MSEVFATVAAPPVSGTAPPLTRICPAASRLTTIVLFWASPTTDRMPVPVANDAVTAGRMRSLRDSRAGKKRAGLGCLRPDREIGRDFFFNIRLNQDSTMKASRKRKRGHHCPTNGL